MHCLQGGKIVLGLLIKDGQPGLAALLVLVLQRVQSKYACSTLTSPGISLPTTDEGRHHHLHLISQASLCGKCQDDTLLSWFQVIVKGC